MEIHPIRNNEDHAAALREIERLEGAAAGTEEGDKLDILAMLFEKYEDSRRPNIDTSDPIDLLNYAIEALRDSQAESVASDWNAGSVTCPYRSQCTGKVTQTSAATEWANSFQNSCDQTVRLGQI